MSIGSMLKSAREKSGLTQKMIAAELNIAMSTISKYENDIMVIPAEVVAGYATVCNVSTDKILGTERSGEPRGLTVDEEELLGVLNQFDTEREKIKFIGKVEEMARVWLKNTQKKSPLPTQEQMENGVGVSIGSGLLDKRINK